MNEDFYFRQQGPIKPQHKQIEQLKKRKEKRIKHIKHIYTKNYLES